MFFYKFYQQKKFGNKKPELLHGVDALSIQNGSVGYFLLPARPDVSKS
jgi:hypothetical protein